MFPIKLVCVNRGLCLLIDQKSSLDLILNKIADLCARLGGTLLRIRLHAKNQAILTDLNPVRGA